MASVRDTVFNMMIHYPSLFQDVSDCFNHLFLVYGNGYEWIDGELCPIDDGIYRDDTREYGWFEPRFLNLEHELIKYPYKKDNIDLARLDVNRHNTQVQFVMNNIDAMIQEPISFTSPYIAFSEYSAIYANPNHISKEWYDAIIRTIYALQAWLNCPSRFYDVHTAQQNLNKCIDKNHTIIAQHRLIMQQVMKEFQ